MKRVNNELLATLYEVDQSARISVTSGDLLRLLTIGNQECKKNNTPF